MSFAHLNRLVVLTLVFIALFAVAVLSQKKAVGGTVPVTAPTANQTPGTTFQVPILATGTTGQGITGFEARIQFDSAVIQPSGPNAGCSTAGTLFAGASVVCNVFPAPNTLSIIVFGLTPISGSGSIINLSFQGIGASGTSSPLIFNSFVFNEGDPAATTTNGAINFFAPTAANANLSGRLLQRNGASAARVAVTLTDGNGFQRSYLTNTFGYFHFRDIPVGRTYFLSSTTKTLRFPVHAVNLTDNVEGIVIVAEN